MYQDVYVKILRLPTRHPHEIQQLFLASLSGLKSGIYSCQSLHVNARPSEESNALLRCQNNSHFD